jgi:ATPase subunit of ABC transporter with duplicated ATPase domains
MSASTPDSGDLMAAPSSVVGTGLSFAWPDGTPVLNCLDITFGTGRTGLVGRNGGGKSTLLRLVAGELTPAGGSIATSGDVAYLSQQLPLMTGRTVADLLGITAKVAALRSITAGDADPSHFATLEDDWEVETRAVETLDRLGVLRGVDGVLDRPVGTLSGGETVLVGVAGLMLRRAAISLMDEPTNNLDRRARALLYQAVDEWRGVLIVVSHDRELLERVDEIVELREGRARTFGGPYSTYVDIVSAEQATATRLVRAAEGDVAREKRQLIETQVKLARRLRTAAKAEREKRVPKIVANSRKRTAQVSAGKYRAVQAGRFGEAKDALTEAEQAVRHDARIQVDLPGTAVPSGQTVVQVGDQIVRGPERLAVIGPNGSGKTTLLEAIVGQRRHPQPGVGRPHVPTAYLPQRLDILDDGRTVLDNVRAAAPTATPNDIRARLARFLVRGNRVEQLAGSLSGGERFRISLACLLLAEPPPRLLLLDEPTNNLDLDSVEQLTDALSGYRGALIVASHDLAFLEDIGVSRFWQVEEMSLPREVVGPA